MVQKNSFDPFYISQLVVKMINGEITVAEQEELNKWLSTDPKNNAILEKLLDQNLWSKEILDMNAYDSDAALQQVLDRISQVHEEKAGQKRLWALLPRFAAAAIVLIALGSVIYMFSAKQAGPHLMKPEQHAKGIRDVDKIMLTLADGTQVDVASVSQGTSINQGGAVITGEKGTLSYRIGETTSSEAKVGLIYNTLTVPVGKQYQVTLPDGSEVWLNSKSSLKYPVVFSGAERIVELIGEGYFEVKHMKNKPFKVRSASQVVEVLGTHFNIEAYPEDQKTTTVLAEGSVSVANGRSSTRLKSGQMTTSYTGGTQLKVEPANVPEALAWKDGLLSFSDERLEDILRKVARSYNVEFDYQGDVKDKRFWGVYPRNKGLANLLKNLEQTNTVHFKVNGRRILVMP